ncbi:unnamed protein product [Rotaria magnacalcarata]
MPRVPIASEDERKFIVDGIQSNFRNDGRNCRAYRPLLLATDVITTANGSCLLKLNKYLVRVEQLLWLVLHLNLVVQTKKNQMKVALKQL